MSLSEFDKNMSAAAFAEAGESETAREILKDTNTRGAAIMQQKKKPYLGALVFGLISLSLYFLVFSNERLVMHEYTMGGWHTVFPVGTALIFSFIHGAFASNFLSVLGIEAKKK
jgi:uncharacterized integral membrane protein